MYISWSVRDSICHWELWSGSVVCILIPSDTSVTAGSRTGPFLPRDLKVAWPVLTPRRLLFSASVSLAQLSQAPWTERGKRWKTESVRESVQSVGPTQTLRGHLIEIFNSLRIHLTKESFPNCFLLYICSLISALYVLTWIIFLFLYIIQEGVIWPRMVAQFHIVFKPEEAKLYQQTIFCDVTGQCLAMIKNATVTYSTAVESCPL